MSESFFYFVLGGNCLYLYRTHCTNVSAVTSTRANRMSTLRRSCQNRFFFFFWNKKKGGEERDRWREMGGSSFFIRCECYFQGFFRIF